MTHQRQFQLTDKETIRNAVNFSDLQSQQQKGLDALSSVLQAGASNHTPSTLPFCFFK